MTLPAAKTFHQELTQDQEPTQEEFLWAAVIWQAVCDGENGVTAFRRAQAKAWFRSDDFLAVCDLAGVSPVEVRRLLVAHRGQWVPTSRPGTRDMGRSRHGQAHVQNHNKGRGEGDTLPDQPTVA